jgi:basic membrane protein A
MKFKKLISLSLTMIISAGILVGCGSSDGDSATEGKIKVGMITDVGGVHDESFNQSSWEGLQAIQKELGKDKLDVNYLESTQDSDYKPNIEQFVEDEYDLIIGVGYKLANELETAAKNYPDQQFAIIDHTYEKQPENITSLSFESNESSYLAGLIAGKSTKTNKVAFIGGQQSPVIDKFEYGFKAGVLAANPDAEVLVQYSNSYSDQALGKSIANSMISKGADVVFTAAGDVGTGSMEAIKEANKYGIGVDRDQSDLAPQNILTSAIKRVDVGMYETVKELVEGKFQGGTSTTYGLEQNGIGIADTTSNLVPQDVLDFVNEKIEELKAGKISVPKTEEEYNEFIKSL